MSTHIGAEKDAVASKVLLPGDPLRAEYIAKTYLKEVVCYNKVRGMYGFTGLYKGERVSIQGSGMGMPSFSIYATELITFYGAKQLIRIGSCGSINHEVKLKDLILTTSAHTDSGMNRERFCTISFAPTASFSLLKKADEKAQELKVPYHVGSVFTSDQFYDDRAEEKNTLLQRFGTLAVEMESAELYTLCSRYGVEGLSLLTVSDHILEETALSSEERQIGFNQMIMVALETLVG